MATTIKLPTVRVSPTTLQYHVPINPGRTIYDRKFDLRSDQFKGAADARKTLSQKWLALTDPLMPTYPYPTPIHFKEANHGLYGGATIQSGNKISDGRNKGKTLRKWYPNVRVEKLRSTALGVEIAIPTTARVMRTITKCGGLDEYLLGEKPARIKELGLLGWKLRWLVLKSEGVQEKWRREREKLGLPVTVDGIPHSSSAAATFSSAWNDPIVRNQILLKMGVEWKALEKRRDKWTKHVRENLKWVKGELKTAGSTLDVHNPEYMQLPDHVEEEEPWQIQVEKGFGIAEIVKDSKESERQKGRSAKTTKSPESAKGGEKPTVKKQGSAPLQIIE